MGVLIKLDGVKFDPTSKYIFDTVEVIPDCEHEYDNACDAECNLCGFTREITHDYDEDGYCTICGARDPSKPYVLEEDYPVYDTSLKGLYDLGGTEEASLVNHANKDIVPTVTGTVDFTTDSRFATFSGASNASRIDTNLQADLVNGVTFVVLFSVPTGYRPLIGNRRGTGSSATHYGLDMLNDQTHLCVDGKSQIQQYNAAINSDNFAIAVMTADTNGCRVLRYSNDVLDVNNPLLNYEGSIDAWTVTLETIRIGGDRLSNVYSDAHVSFAAIHEGVMTDEQLESICEFVKIYGEQKGLIIE